MFGANPMGARRLWALIDGLPNDSALHRAVDPDGAGLDWDRQAHLTAILVEVADRTNAILAAQSGHKYEPVSIKRPGKQEPEALVPITGEEMEASIAAIGGVVKATKRKRKHA